MTANSYDAASTPTCQVLESCQPVDYDSGYTLTVRSATGAAQNCPGDAAALQNIDTIIDYRRTMCACKYGELKAPSSMRCDPIKRIATHITVAQDIRSPDGENLFKANTVLQNKIRLFIGQRIFMTPEAKAAGLYEANEENLLALVKIVKIEDKASITTAIEKDRRLDEVDRDLLASARTMAPTWAGHNSGPGVTITYTVSIENKPVVSSMSTANVENTIPQNIQLYVSDIVSYKPTAVRVSAVADSFAEGLTTMIKGSSACGSTFSDPCVDTFAALSGVPVPGTVVTERTSGPTAAPTFAPTARADYVSSPIIMFSIAGGVALLLFSYTCFRHHNPAETSGAKKTEVVKPKTVPAKATAAPEAAIPSPPPASALAVLPPSAPTPAEENADASLVQAGRA